MDEEQEPPAASKAKGKHRQQKAEQESKTEKKKGKKKGKTEPEDTKESRKRSVPKKESTAKTAPEDDDAQHYMEPPPKKVRKIQKFVALYWDDATTTVATDDIKHEMKSQLKPLTTCRLNIYWKTSACGCTYRETGKDVAHFYFGKETGYYMTRLAMAVKCAEMFVAWVHEVWKTKNYNCSSYVSPMYSPHMNACRYITCKMSKYIQDGTYIRI